MYHSLMISIAPQYELKPLLGASPDRKSLHMRELEKDDMALE